MTDNTGGNLESIAALADKIAFELAFAESGKDDVLLPVNCLLTQLEELGPAAPPTPEIDRAIRLAREGVDKALATAGLLDSALIKRLGEHLSWLQSACEAAAHSRPLPNQPTSWSDVSAPAETPATKEAPATSAIEVPADTAMPLIINMQCDGELLREFVNESHEHLQNIELGVIELEQGGANADTLNSVFRAFHTFKGGAGLLNLTPIYKLAHELESLLDQLRKHKLGLSRPIINIILEGGDTLKRFVGEINAQISGSKPPEAVVIPIGELIVRVRRAMQPDSQAADALAEESRPTAPRADAPTGATSSGGVVKVDTQKLDNLVDLVGEMMIIQSQVIHDTGTQTVQHQRLARNLARLGRVTTDLQRTALSLRMVPIRGTFQKMVRLVRDLAGKQGKKVELKMSGEETEVDRTIVDQINDPLVHMIRNSVDHGIEMPDIRQAAGKPAVGTIHLRACHRGGNIVIEIADDGAGLNRERILAKAIAAGITNANAELGDNEIFQFIFHAGLSTAEKVTDVSGRGVGMDVVRRNVEKLHGKISIQSALGQGSTFSVQLPLTLAIIDGMLVGVGAHRYILPTLNVRKSFRPTADMISIVQGRGEVVNVRGQLWPLLRLHQYFGVKTDVTDATRGTVIMIGTGLQNRCILVDELLGKQEVVIKSLGETFKSNRALAGGAILGDGSVGLILDVDALVQLRSAEMAQAA
ncbi:MAG: chemotaxis protein CheA [Verrucomicrobiia bacterium]